MSRYRLHQLTLSLDYTDDDILPAAALKLKCEPDRIGGLTVVRRSIDARGKPVFSLTVEFDLTGDLDDDGKKLLRPADDDVPLIRAASGGMRSSLRPVVIGAGPSGLMAALFLARSGAFPVLYERGCPVVARAPHVAEFWKSGTLRAESNVLFGEGGGGLFSDGKLTTRSKDERRARFFLETLRQCGAPPSVLVDAEPHLGTDALGEIIPRLRKAILAEGGEIHFNSCLTGLHIEDGRLAGVSINGADHETACCVLATGHSARDVYRLLHRSGVTLEPKPFAMGVRVEVSQSKIDAALWGRSAGHPRLGPAGFRLTRKQDRHLRACYTFCMCPGGTVVSCASSDGMLTTNGMSSAARSQPFGNAAFLVPVVPEDFRAFRADDAPALAGCDMQMHFESMAYSAAGEDYSIPAATLSDFMRGKAGAALPEPRSFIRVKPAPVHTLLPEYVREPLVHWIPRMLEKITGPDYENVLVYGPETRSSSPVRIVRDDNRESVAAKGLYPCGEGAGYAGGIVSSAIDGIRAAEHVGYVWLNSAFDFNRRD